MGQSQDGLYYRTINFYYCFGDDRPKIITENHKKRKARSLELLSTFRYSQADIQKLRANNIAKLEEFYRKLNGYYTDPYKQRELYNS